MNAHVGRMFPNRKFKPGVSSLEDRCTPTVNSVSVLAATPGLGGGATVTIGGLVQESSAAAATNLSLSYTVSDSHGQVLGTGTLNPQRALPNSTAIPFETTIPLSVTRGNTEAISVSASDSGSMGVPLVSFANLIVAPTAKVSTLGVGITELSGDHFSGNGQGRITLSESASQGFIAKGNGVFRLSSYPHNQTQLLATAQGKFQFGINPQGNIGMKVTNGFGLVNVGSYASGPIANGGFSASLFGNLNFTRLADSSLQTNGKGNGHLAVQFTSGSPMSPTPSTISSVGQNLLISVLRDPTGVLNFSAGGNVGVSGNVATSN